MLTSMDEGYGSKEFDGFISKLEEQKIKKVNLYLMNHGLESVRHRKTTKTS